MCFFLCVVILSIAYTATSFVNRHRPVKIYDSFLHSRPRDLDGGIASDQEVIGDPQNGRLPCFNILFLCIDR